MKKQREELFSTRNKVNVSIRTYATLNNRFLDRINSKKNKYSFDKVNQQNQQKKGPRPLIILWSNKYSDKIIACSESTKQTKYNDSFSFSFIDKKENKKYWKYEVLVLNKSKTTIINNHIWCKYPEDLVNDFFKSWKNQINSQVALAYFKKLKLKYENESKDEIIKILKKQINIK